MLSVIKHPWTDVFVSDTLNASDVSLFASNVSVLIIFFFLFFHQVESVWNQLKEKNHFFIFKFIWACISLKKKNLSIFLAIG